MNRVALPFEIKYNRFLNLIPIPFIILLVSVFIYVFLNPTDEDGRTLKPLEYVVFSFLGLIGLFLIFHFTRMTFKPMSLFKMNQEGFEYNEGGIGTGLIRWSEVKEIKEIEILQKTSMGPRWIMVLAVFLKDHDAYIKKRSMILSKTMEASETLYGTSIFLTPAYFSKQYDAVKLTMQEQVSKAGSQN